MARKKTLGQLVAERRQAAGLTQAELASCIGTAVMAVSNIERGVSTPKATTLLAIAKSLGIDVGDLEACQ